MSTLLSLSFRVCCLFCFLIVQFLKHSHWQMVLWGKGLQVLSVHWEEMTAKDWQIEKTQNNEESPPIMGQLAVSSQSHLVLGAAQP